MLNMSFAFRFPFAGPDIWPPTVQTQPSWLLHLGSNAGADLPDTSLWCRRSEAVSDRCLAWTGGKRHQWRNWRVAQTSPCVRLRQRRTFWAFNLIQGHTYAIFSFSVLWTLQASFAFATFSAFAKYVKRTIRLLVQPSRVSPSLCLCQDSQCTVCFL